MYDTEKRVALVKKRKAEQVPQKVWNDQRKETVFHFLRIFAEIKIPVKQNTRKHEKRWNADFSNVTGNQPFKIVNKLFKDGLIGGNRKISEIFRMD